MDICSDKELKMNPIINNQHSDGCNYEAAEIGNKLPAFCSITQKLNNQLHENQTQLQPKAIGTGTMAHKIFVSGMNLQVSEYDEALKILIKNTVFEDDNFKADAQSISKTTTFPLLKDCVWKRSQAFLKSAPRIFNDQIGPNDIKQGQLGDCYFLSSLSVLAEQPDLIKRLFITQTFQENGLHGVYLCHDGEFIQIALDDQFPCNTNGGPLFSQCKGSELWVQFLEKAYAKIYGTYEKIAGGFASDAIEDLTGAIYEIYRNDEKSQNQTEQCWDFIYQNFQKKYLMAADSLNFQEIIDPNGIVRRHCYSILQAQKVVGSDGKPDNIIQMRNPWGRQEWTGDWSDKSAKWTPELQKQFSEVDADDGIYWISVNDFVKEFNHVSVNKVHPDYLYNSMRLQTQPLSQSVLRCVVIMRVSKQTHAFICLHQKDSRAYKLDNEIAYSYSSMNMIIGQIDSKTNEISTCIGNVLGSLRKVNIEYIFQPGEYNIYIEVKWSQNFVRDLIVSAYGESAIQFSEIHLSEVDTAKIFNDLQLVQKDTGSSNLINIKT